MFCEKCGMELKEGWNSCPKCGTVLGADNSSKEDDKFNLNTKPSGQKSRDELREDLADSAFSEKGGVVLAYGASAISKDLVKILNPDEEIISFYHADRSSLLGFIKPARMFREYIVCTNKRLIYVENAAKAFSLLPFLSKSIPFPYKEIANVTSDKRIGIFSGKVIIESTKKKMVFAVTNRKNAEELKEFLLNEKTK